MTEDDILELMLENDRLRAALTEIAEFYAGAERGYVDEWEEAAAFTRCQEIARQALESGGD